MLPNHLHLFICGVDEVELASSCDLRGGSLRSWKLDNWVKVSSPFEVVIVLQTAALDTMNTFDATIVDYV